MAHSKEKMKSNGDNGSPYVKPFLIVNMFAYQDAATGFIHTHFYKPYQCHQDTKLNDESIQHLHPNRNINSFEVLLEVLFNFYYNFFSSI
jgi:hypothetical protein